MLLKDFVKICPSFVSVSLSVKNDLSIKSSVYSYKDIFKLSEDILFDFIDGNLNVYLFSFIKNKLVIFVE